MSSENFSDVLTSLVWKDGVVVSPLLELLGSLLPAVEAACMRQSPVGCYHRAQAALTQLHTVEKRFETTDQLMVSNFICVSAPHVCACVPISSISIWFMSTFEFLLVILCLVQNISLL